MSINNDTATKQINNTAAKQILGAEVLTGTLNELHARQLGKKVSNPFEPASKDVIGGNILSSTIKSVNAMQSDMNHMGSAGSIVNKKS